ncbi:protein-L-isoaspartate O-methyltransferase family protein [Janibacter sp. GS2]|uniref:protein-L-isoaspartate O-methyltransferase family protein n=1 Tax=Janibacter sp. GS2 TaxID=3442646 RepID=UPI003EB78A86
MDQDAVDEAFARTPRAGFLPERDRRRAAEDRPVPIGHDQTNSQPSTVAAMLRLLDVRPGQGVLDVGSGSGWTTALLADLVGSGGRVIGVERVPSLVDTSRAVLAPLDRPWARVRQAEPGVLGAPGEAPFDRILVSAEAQALPEELIEQLTDEGVLVVPVRGEMVRLARDAHGRRVTRHGFYRFVPLIAP